MRGIMASAAAAALLPPGGQFSTTSIAICDKHFVADVADGQANIRCVIELRLGLVSTGNRRVSR